MGKTVRVIVCCRLKVGVLSWKFAADLCLSSSYACMYVSFSVLTRIVFVVYVVLTRWF